MSVQSYMTFAVVGSGNVASHLATALCRSGAECVAVFSRTLDHAELLSTRLGTVATSDLLEFFGLVASVDVVFLAVADNAIPLVVESVPSDFSPVVLSTSGSTPISVLGSIPHHGVLYPMQTFSKGREVMMAEVPFFVEYGDEHVAKVVQEVARRLGTKSVSELSSENRMRMHMSAVFGCNFVNHMYALAEKCLEGTGVPFSALAPLLEETLRKALGDSPVRVQTGPAVRNDTQTLERHMQLLENQPQLRRLYKILSDSIYEQSS